MELITKQYIEEIIYLNTNRFGEDVFSKIRSRFKDSTFYYISISNDGSSECCYLIKVLMPLYLRTIYQTGSDIIYKNIIDESNNEIGLLYFSKDYEVNDYNRQSEQIKHIIKYELNDKYEVENYKIQQNYLFVKADFIISFLNLYFDSCSLLGNFTCVLDTSIDAFYLNPVSERSKQNLVMHSSLFDGDNIILKSISLSESNSERLSSSISELDVFYSYLSRYQLIEERYLFSVYNKIIEVSNDEVKSNLDKAMNIVDILANSNLVKPKNDNKVHDHDKLNAIFEVCFEFQDFKNLLYDQLNKFDLEYFRESLKSIFKSFDSESLSKSYYNALSASDSSAIKNVVNNDRALLDFYRTLIYKTRNVIVHRSFLGYNASDNDRLFIKLLAENILNHIIYFFNKR